MLFDPRPWQPPMLDHMREHDRCRVFAGMGSGKTGATLMTVSAATALDEGPVLVIGPKRVANKTWPDEARKWDQLRGLSIRAAIGSVTERFQALGAKADITTINFQNLPWLVDHYEGSKRWPFRTIVYDEDTRLRGFRLRQGRKEASALGQVAHLPRIKRWIGLTGTPAPNGYRDMWGPMWFIDKGQRLGLTHDAFMKRWFYTEYGGNTINALPFAAEQIQDKIRDVCVSINPADYIDIPDPIMNPIKVELPSKVRAIYREMEVKFMTEVLGHEIEAVHAAAKSAKLLQMASGAVWIDREEVHWEELHREKLSALESVIEEANGTPVLVAYQWKFDLWRLQKAFPQGREFDDDPKTEDAWNEGRIPVMFVHPQSGGHGSNLQWGGNHLAFFSHGWSREHRWQVIERIGPMRQFQSNLHRPVFIHDIVAENTIDEDVLVRHATNRAVQDVLLEAMTRRNR